MIVRYGMPILGVLSILAFSCAAASHATLQAGASEPMKNRRVLLDCYFNNEWKKNDAGVMVRYHYVWDDTADSGFSQLATVIESIGGTVDTLCNAPTLAALRRARVYAIVDPDTPEETASPHYIDQQTIEVVAKWVKSGGVLVLLGNDKGKAEFEHLNNLAERFGIHFNEDSRNRVTGRQFELGTFEKLPDHRLFKGVRKIFIKELSTLKIHTPAKAVLSDGGDVIMAFSQIGKGGVFAVGDPWFYNEYMDQRRLPAGYDNKKAAENLFRWLLEFDSHP
jgi:unsaturated rhamnogalacturonyl hydrolase